MPTRRNKPIPEEDLEEIWSVRALMLASVAALISSAVWVSLVVISRLPSGPSLRPALSVHSE
jgi:hypothetical protein